jgi:amino acid transporter
MPYLALFPAFLKLRNVDKDMKRPYKVPGGNITAWVMAVICVIFILQAIVFFIWVPGEPIDWAYAGPILIGVVITLVIGEILLLISRRNKARSDA